MPSSHQETEITLGTGRMLAIFFAIVLVCAVFFGIGFSLGKKTSLLGVNSASGGTAAATVRPSGGGKETTKPASQSTDFSFYKSVGSNSANTELTPPESQTQPAGSSSSAPSASAAASSTSGGPAANGAAASGGYLVQVAAVNRQEDAEALVEALKKKQYPAFAANNSATDKYYHVQIGPYADLKEAEAMRTRLIADGYNPILKK